MTQSWDAFISYARAGSATEAAALQTGIERFAKPWNRLRACRVFRDDASMSANAGLWSAIEGALTDSQCLILILSRAAAQSPYVNNEVRWWVEHKSPTTVLLVHDDGTLAWDRVSNRFSADTDCVPPPCSTPMPRSRGGWTSPGSTTRSPWGPPTPVSRASSPTWRRRSGASSVMSSSARTSPSTARHGGWRAAVPPSSRCFWASRSSRPRSRPCSATASRGRRARCRRGSWPPAPASTSAPTSGCPSCSPSRPTRRRTPP